MKNSYKIIFLISCLFIITQLSFAQSKKELVILHTNDMHSQIEPFDNNIGGHKAGKGGMVRIATFINEEKQKYPNNCLILDAGDFSQGTVYYNVFHGEVEIKIMNTIGYDAVTIGNHEFDLGLENLSKLIKMANFPFINCNYDFSQTCLKDLVKPYIIVERDGLKIGIFGLGPDELQNISFSPNYKGVIFKDSFKSANETADLLRNTEQCDIVICLSHIGWTGYNFCDSTLAAKSHNIDIIVGGHSHTYMEHPKQVRNLDSKIVYINQTGSNTTNVGKMVVELNGKK